MISLYSDGMGEVIKYGAIKDRELFYKLMNYENKEAVLKDIDKIIYTCCRIKATMVEADERDTGERMLLNFGHTIGHAIEQFFNYEYVLPWRSGGNGDVCYNRTRGRTRND